MPTLWIELPCPITPPPITLLDDEILIASPVKFRISRPRIVEPSELAPSVKPVLREEVWPLITTSGVVT